MSEFQDKVAQVKEQAIAKLRRWDKEKAATEILREYLGEEGLNGQSNLDNLLTRMKGIALHAEDLEVSRKATKDLLEMAAGASKVNVQNNSQYNFGDFLKELK